MRHETVKRVCLLIVVIVLATALVAIFAACDEQGNYGMSAYELAVSNGFDGTEEEWLASLEGKDGTDGENGINGENGEDRVMSPSELYQEAVANGYTGTYLDFLKEYLSSSSSAITAYATNAALRSAVSVVCTFDYTSTNIFGQTQTGTAKSSGSGVIYKLDKASGSCYIITNYHVVYYKNSNTEDKISDDIKIYLYGYQLSSTSVDYAIEATYVGGSLNYDIAVLKVTNSEILKNSDAVSASVATEVPAVGSTAIAVGNPAGSGISATSGVISVQSEYIQMTGADDQTTVQIRVMRVDTAINSGNSGGGLYNANGELIGIVNAKVNSSSIENIGYAIPVSTAVSVAENILNSAEAGYTGVRKCMLGIETAISESYAKYNEAAYTYDVYEIIKVSSVDETGISSGLLQAGDILKSVTVKSGEASKTVEITRLYVLTELMLDLRVGDTLSLTVDRDGAEVTVEIVMTKECVSAVA